jgi:ABC-2 type transport system permease protein
MSDETAASGPPGEVGSARILERGYRSYDGPRLGVRGAMGSLTRHSVQRVLGLKRTFWNKILPFGAIFLAYVPAIVFVGAAVFLKDRFEKRGISVDQIIPSYGEYYLFVWAAIQVFAAFAAPEVLCTDRRNGMLGLYLASPLKRDTYLAAKAAAVGLVLTLVTIGPPLFMLLARAIAGVGPEGVGGFASVLWKVFVGGLIVAVLPVALSLAIASTTTRRAAASAAYILVSIGSIAVTETLIAAGSSANVFVFDLAYLPLELVGRLFNEPPGTILTSATTVPTGNLVAAYLLFTAALVAFVRFRYQRIQVTR